MTVLRRRAVLAGAAAATLGAPAIVNAQNLAQGSDWPKGPIKIIVPFPPGGSTDPVARIIQAKLIDNTGWNILVDNKPGGTGVVGASDRRQVAARRPDLDGDLRQPHPQSGLRRRTCPYKDSDLFNVMLIGRTPQAIARIPTGPTRRSPR